MKNQLYLKNSIKQNKIINSILVILKYLKNTFKFFFNEKIIIIDNIKIY